jgi:hypothetical protein
MKYCTRKTHSAHWIRCLHRKHIACHSHKPCRSFVVGKVYLLKYSKDFSIPEKMGPSCRNHSISILISTLKQHNFLVVVNGKIPELSIAPTRLISLPAKDEKLSIRRRKSVRLSRWWCYFRQIGQISQCSGCRIEYVKAIIQWSCDTFR